MFFVDFLYFFVFCGDFVYFFAFLLHFIDLVGGYRGLVDGCVISRCANIPATHVLLDNGCLVLKHPYRCVRALDTFWHFRCVWASARVVALATAEFAGSVALV